MKSLGGKGGKALKKEVEEVLTFDGVTASLKVLQGELKTLLSEDNINLTEVDTAQKEIGKLEKALGKLRKLQQGEDVAALDGGGIDSVQSSRISSEEETGDRINEIRATNREINSKADRQQAAEDAEARAELIKQAEEIAFQLAEQGADAIFQIRGNKLEREISEREEALETQFNPEFEAAEGNEELQLQLDQEFEAEKEALQNEASYKRKANAKKEAFIQGALAVIKTFAQFGFPAGILPALGQVAQTAIQLSVIDSQEFADGGRVKDFQQMTTGKVKGTPNIRPTDRGDNMVVRAKVGEMFLNKRSQRKAEAIYGNDVWRNIGIPDFVDGGIVGGTTAPQLIQPATLSGSSGGATASRIVLTDAQAERQAKIIAKATAEAVQMAIGRGLNDANRRLEREEILNGQTGI